MRLIDADALIGELHNYAFLEGDDRAIAYNIIQKQPTINQWIPCSERLPEEDEEVLVSVHFKGLKQTYPSGWNEHIKGSWYVETAHLIDDEWSSYSDEYKVARNRHEVIAWMPLPKPYEENKE